ncbi:MAG: MurR/RpiR family transcriptional regulator [Advenella sp.]
MTFPVEDRLKEIYETLPHSERLLADLLLDFPGVLATHAMSEVVQRAKTSNAAATRLVKRLGYKNVQEIRKQVRQAREDGSPRYLNKLTHDDGDYKSSIQQHVNCEIQNVLQTFEAVGDKAIKEIVSGMKAARKIWIVGYGNSYMPAMYLRQQLIQIRDQVELLPRPGQAIEKEISAMTRRDMMIVIGFRRHKELRFKLMKYAKAMDARVLYITDQSEEKTGNYTNWTIRCMVQSTSLFDSYTSGYSVLNYLCASLSDLLGKVALERLSQSEKLYDLFDEK